MLKLCVEKRLILQSKIENRSFQGNVKATFSHLLDLHPASSPRRWGHLPRVIQRFSSAAAIDCPVSSSKVVGTSGFEERRGMSVNMECPVSGQGRNRHEECEMQREAKPADIGRVCHR